MLTVSLSTVADSKRGASDLFRKVYVRIGKDSEYLLRDIQEFSTIAHTVCGKCVSNGQHHVFAIIAGLLKVTCCEATILRNANGAVDSTQK